MYYDLIRPFFLILIPAFSTMLLLAILIANDMYLSYLDIFIVIIFIVSVVFVVVKLNEYIEGILRNWYK